MIRTQFNSHITTRARFALLLGLATLFGTAVSAPARADAPETDLGRAVADMGGNTIQVRAADAIYVTCISLATAPSLTPDQAQLGGRCADMTQTGFALDPTPNPSTVPPAADVFGLGAGGIPQYFALLQQLSGEEASTQGRYATEGTASQFKSLAGRLGAIRRGASRGGITFNLQGVDVLTVADSSSGESSLLGGGAGDSDADLGWAWFANVEYGFGDRDRTGNEDGYDADSLGGLIGVDYAFNEALTLGAAFNYSTSTIDFDRQSSGGLDAVSGGDIDTDMQSISVFVNYVSGQFYTSAIVNAGWGEIDMSRPVLIPLATTGGVSGGLAPLNAQAKSSTDSEVLSAEAQVGYTFGEGATSWDLYGGLNVTDLEIDRFTETGTPLGLTYGEQEIDSFKGFLGAAVRRSISTKSGVIVPYVSVEYRYEFDNESRSIDARYTLSPATNTAFFTNNESDNFDILTDDADSDYFDVTVGVSAQFRNNVAAFLQFGTVLGLTDTSANLLTVGIRGAF
jgi:uncharacterized protein YhjY with autotransporter beta-barrel domain